MSANPRHSSWSDKMPNKLRKHFARLLPKIKTTRNYLSRIPPPKQIANSTKSMILNRCTHSRTLSIAGPDQTRRHSAPQSTVAVDPAATLADVDKFLFENFKSLFQKAEEFKEAQNGHENGGNGESDDEDFSYGLPKFDDDEDDDPVREIGSNQRFFASPLKSSTLFRDDKIPDETGIAVLTSSSDPYDGFRASMIEMIQSRLRKQKQLEWGFMEELLFSYLNMNERTSFKYILCAFSDLVVGLRRGSGRWKNPGAWGRNKGGDVTFEFN
ncbi:hypothetical protein Scep_007674 [Stephania cephalantha]|uniref:Transcription repressor n=1 Tax=Stephania cephalantha TaxID=152367 RepID=A0AAP0KAI9_9MAGN